MQRKKQQSVAPFVFIELVAKGHAIEVGGPSEPKSPRDVDMEESSDLEGEEE